MINSYALRFTKNVFPLLKINTSQTSISIQAIQAIAKRSFSTTPPLMSKVITSPGDIGTSQTPSVITGKFLTQKAGRPRVVLFVTAKKIIWIALKSLKIAQTDETIIIRKDDDNRLHNDSIVVINQVSTTDHDDPLLKKIGSLKNSWLYQRIMDKFLNQIKLASNPMISHQGDIVEVKTAEGISFQAIVISNEKRGANTALIARMSEGNKAKEPSSLLYTSFKEAEGLQEKNIIIDMLDLHTVSKETVTVIGKARSKVVSMIYDAIEKLAK
ncbi:hypothetical protein [Rhabdochlamydiaceae symbiont of Dictyostelium giganteum]|uniref:hypothetical protein n=1 Tax=Rhabdochlamydiaceae symbiont of Dictyostelium giganteum TaxID=3342349 RepID=UPI003850A42D